MEMCNMCGETTKGRGYYRFTYLDETVSLCGHCAQKIMKYITGEK